MTDYEKRLARVAETRLQRWTLEAEKQRLYDDWLTANADLLKALDVARDAQEVAEAALRTAAVDAYYHDGQKQRPGDNPGEQARLL